MHRRSSFESGSGTSAGSGSAGECLSSRVAAWRQSLTGLDLDALHDDERLAILHELELLGRTMSAVSVHVQVGFYSSQVAVQIEQGVAPSRAGKAVPDDLALASMTSPYWGSRHLTSARALVGEMPRTLAALADGVIDDDQARTITEVTACLSPEDRGEVDHRLAEALPGSSTREIVAAARALVYEIDPKGYVERARRAAKDRGVTIRPCPDVMGLLSARLPAPEAIACYQSLKKHAAALSASGDPRTLQQLMADELYARLTGRSVVDGIDVEVGLVITDAALFGGTSDAADLTGFGPIPAETARDLLRPGGDADRGHDPEPHGQAHGPVPTVETPDPEPATGEQASARAPEAPGAGSPRSPRQISVCPAGERCTDFACAQVHGTPPPAAGAREGGPVAAPGAGTPEPAAPTAGSAGQGSADLRAARVWLRRLFTDPATGRLLGRDNRRRFFTGSLRDLVIARDQTCRNAWCGAPVRHVDHIQRFADDGATDTDNGQGLCARCNLAREHPRHLHPPPESYRPPPPLLPVFLRAS